MPKFMAVDAGGTLTRAVLLDSSGTCLGYGTAGGGNPVSRGFRPALDAIAEASAQALGGTPSNVAGALLAMAGASLEPPLQLFRDRFVELGLTGNLMIESDLLAAFYSGTHHDHGLALIAGTGAVGARVSEGRLAQVADGAGWLLGDVGSGFWLGREVARAVASALDGRGQATALTELVLADLGIPLDPGERDHGRVRAQQQLTLKVYESSAIELSRFAPLAFAAQADVVAQDIINRAAAGLAQTLLAVSVPAVVDGGAAALEPLVFGGSVLTKATAITTGVMERLAAASNGPAVVPVMVQDGVIGSAVMVLKHHEITVDETVFARIGRSLAGLRG